MELTLHTGCAGDEIKINIDWFNENNVHQETELVIRVQDQDKPRQLEITVNTVTVATIRHA